MIEVVGISGVVLVQDSGRPGRMHQGIPPGGALVPELLARANAAAANQPGEAALEIFGAVAIASRRGGLRVATDDGAVSTLDPGTVWRVACEGARVRYAAVRGGVAVPEVLGGRGTLLVAGLGGHEGRPLRKGDVLPVGDATACSIDAPPVPDPRSPIRVVGGPDARRFGPRALEVLLTSEYRVSLRSDRVGLRLTGPALSRVDDDAAASTPMVRGAIQVPASGEPIVLGPDHPTMGGYPVLATVVSSDLGALMVRSPGDAVRFVTAFVTAPGGGGT
jgi:biotin-dependent carboxylase-like uncharacterized protein